MSDFMFTAALTFALLLPAGASASTEWQAPRYQEHSLVGQIWSHQAQAFVSASDLFEAGGRSEYLLLGEKHDNPDHHTRRLALLQELVAAERIGLISFEMLSRQQQSRLDSLDPALSGDEDALREHLDWDIGWHWPWYQPVLELGLQADGLQLVAANLDSSEIVAVYRDGVPDETLQRLDATARLQLVQDIDDSHCGLLPDDQIPAMAAVQQARDQAMAESLQRPLAESREASATRVLVAGNFHIRHDLGVPNYLDSESVVTVAFLEVDPERTEPAAYQGETDGKAAWDFIWFTPAIEEVDYCERMQESVAGEEPAATQ